MALLPCVPRHNLFLMYMDVLEGNGTTATWEQYVKKLQASGQFKGGSAIGRGECVTKSRTPKSTTSHLAGYIRVQAESFEAAKKLLEGNSVFEAGGTVETRLISAGTPEGDPVSPEAWSAPQKDPFSSWIAASSVFFESNWVNHASNNVGA
jgi:hypothetical protein